MRAGGSITYVVDCGIDSFLPLLFSLFALELEKMDT